MKLDQRVFTDFNFAKAVVLENQYESNLPYFSSDGVYALFVYAVEGVSPSTLAPWILGAIARSMLFTALVAGGFYVKLN